MPWGDLERQGEDRSGEIRAPMPTGALADAKPEAEGGRGGGRRVRNLFSHLGVFGSASSTLTGNWGVGGREWAT